jgi:L-ascorbate metabolism protein UlaG (beta-lactamase superfamily)
LRWDEEMRVGPATVRGFAVNHWGARMRTDTYRGYSGYVVEVGARRILFAGDTAITDSFRPLRRRREIDLAIMPIGAYNPWIRYHCTPEQAVTMANDAGAGLLIPVHHQTFHLSREPLDEPIERFLAANRGTPERVVLTDIGGEFHMA